MSLKISIILCTYNRANFLRRMLEALARQSMKQERFEVIVVDDGSTDETPAVCTSMMEKLLPNLKYITTGKNQGIAAAANVGVEQSRGDHVLFTDDDCIASDDWCAMMSAALETEHIVAGSIESPADNYIKLCHNIAEFHPFMPGMKAGYVDFIAGANMGFRRSVLNELGGFSTDWVTAPDTEMILRAKQKGYKIYFSPDARVQHDHARTSFFELLRYSSSHARTTILMRNKYRGILKTPVVLRSPVLLLLASPLIALRVTTGIYFRNFQTMKVFWTAPVVFATKLAWCWGAASSLLSHERIKGEVWRKA